MLKINKYKATVLLFFSFIVSCANHSIASYNRSEWGRWADKNHDCFDTRQEILRSRSEVVPKIETRGKKCYVVFGLWSDYYFPEKLASQDDIDIDHLVPLKHAHDAGGSEWTQSMKAKFANDPENLVITNKTYNRRKGSKSIDKWLPIDVAYACKYYRDWMKVKHKYKLVVSKQEESAVDIKSCDKD